MQVYKVIYLKVIIQIYRFPGGGQDDFCNILILLQALSIPPLRGVLL
jgi:hypothetical protein